MKRKEALGDRAEGDTIQAHTACTVVSSAVPGHELLLYFEGSGRSETVGEARAKKTSTNEVSCSSTETLIRAVQAHAERWKQAVASVDFRRLASHASARLRGYLSLTYLRRMKSIVGIITLHIPPSHNVV
jgi:hypothetical protein